MVHRVLLILAAAILAVSVLYAGSRPAEAKHDAAAPALESSAVKSRGSVSAAERVERTRAYWTPRRMANATPMPMGVSPALETTPSAPPQNGLEWTGPSSNPPARTTGRLVVTTDIGDPSDPTDDHHSSCSASTVDSPAKDLVLTAGHCVLDYDDPNAVLVHDATFVPGYHCDPLEPPAGDGCYPGRAEEPYGEWVAKSIMVHPEWQNSRNWQYDIAAVWVFPSGGTEGKRLVDVVGGNEIGFNLPAERETYVFGYPSNFKNGQVLHYCNGSTHVRNSWEMYIGCRFGPGSSGGPWLTAFGGERGVLYSVTSRVNDLSNPIEIMGPSFDDSVRDFYNGIVGTDSAPPSTIAYQGWDGADLEIYSMDSEGREKHSLTNNNTFDTYPSYSPNGENIAFSRLDGADSEIYSMNSDGQGESLQLTNNDTHDSRPSYSGDGTRIAYEHYDGNDWEIYTINATGGTPVQVTNNDTDDRDPDYAPHDPRIAYRGEDGPNGDYEIYTINATGGTPVQVTNNDTDDLGPDYAPIGETIAYQGWDGNDSEIYEISSVRVPSPPEPRLQITYNDRDDGAPSYSPNGAHIVYMGDDGHDLEIYRINRTYGYVRQFTNNSTEDANPSWGILRKITHPEKTKVPEVLEFSSGGAGRAIRNAGLVPKFTGDPPGARSWVVSQSPSPYTVVDWGSTVTCRLTKKGIPP